MNGLLRGIAATALCTVPASADPGQAAGCERQLAPSSASARRPLTAGDLVRLRDLGSNGDPASEAGTVALSPDRRSLAFQLRRADPDRNGFCLGLFVLKLAPGARARLIDLGEEPILMSGDFRGKAGFPSGIMAPIIPQWTPNGDAILFLKRTDGRTRIWHAAVDGSGSHAITDGPDDVADFSLDPRSQTLRFRTRSGLGRGSEALYREGLEGFRFDDRFSPMTGSRPFVRAPADEQVWTQSQPFVDNAPVRASPETSDALPRGVVHGHQGQSAWLAFDRATFPPTATLHVRTSDGAVLSCGAPVCDRHVWGLWWTPGGRLRFFRREGWGNEATAIYEWLPGRQEPRRLLLTRDILSSCLPVDDDIICVREASARPRYIARIDILRHRETVLFDPNPEFEALNIGRIERLHWRNRYGLEIFGDLVYPIGYRPGRRYPLIIVQYDSRGFLRGGTGDEYPIQLFAAHGYAVLSFNRPPAVGLFRGARTIAEAERVNLADFADRRSVHSALERGIEMIVRRGVADPSRIGITGLSDGASTVQFGLLNSRLFGAAAMSSCCWDASLAWRVGPGSMRDFSAMGYPGALSDTHPFWNGISIARNAARVRTPLLLQLADREYLAALTAFTALRERSAPVDLYVFPDEMHIKWQPAHRMAVYRRSLAWFDFWLRHDESSATPEELAHWTGLRAASTCLPTSCQ